MAQTRNVTEDELAKIKEFIETIKFGSVNIIIQDGKIVQIDKSEKIRI
ncbi:DUF2292 domain-containing protein [Pseudobutyrivibrio sp.]